MSNDIRYGAPCSMCGGASGHPADGSGCDRPAPHFGTTDILATGPTRPGFQHSPATYVEGREAPKREAFSARMRTISGHLPDGAAVTPSECDDPCATCKHRCHHTSACQEDGCECADTTAP